MTPNPQSIARANNEYIEPEDDREPIPLAASLYDDGTIHIYIDEKYSGLRIERDADDVLVIHPGDSARWRIAR